MTITFNPYKTFGDSPAFNVSSQGYVQGDAQDDPAIQLQLEAGTLADSVTVQAFPGVPLTLLPPVRNNQKSYGGAIAKTLVVGHIDAWVVTNRNYNAIIVPGNPVPTWGPGETVHFYRPGSKARIPLPLGPDMVAYVTAGVLPLVYYWDSVNHYVTSVAPSDGSAAVPIVMTDLDVTGTTITQTGTPAVFTWAYGMPIGVFIV